jgi:hypothetical protein
VDKQQQWIDDKMPCSKDPHVHSQSASVAPGCSSKCCDCWGLLW